MRCTSSSCLFVVLLVRVAIGQTNIDAGHQFAWSENLGWLNWRDADAGDNGVRVRATFLAGFIWSENTGWINVGNGSVLDGLAYGNDPGDSSTFGVNIDPASSDLFGLAWGENVGWVNFDTRSALGSFGQQARFDFAAGRFHGYAWGENVGWVNLDDTTHYVAYIPPNCAAPFADIDGDNDVDQSDFGAWQVCFSGSGNVASVGCECFDRPETGFPRGDNDVDRSDLDVFELCVSGPAIPLDSACAD